MKFVILDHTPEEVDNGDVRSHSNQRHFDWMFELIAGGPLTTFATPHLPSVGDSTDATQLPDHRPVYLQYEGPISGRWHGDITERATLVLDAIAMKFAGQTWEICITPDDRYLASSADDSAGCSGAGRFRSLNRLL